MPETIHSKCHGEGCADCQEIGVLGWENPRAKPRHWQDEMHARIHLPEGEHVGSGIGFTRILATHSLRGIMRGMAGESPSAMKSAAKALAERGEKP